MRAALPRRLSLSSAPRQHDPEDARHARDTKATTEVNSDAFTNAEPIATTRFGSSWVESSRRARLRLVNGASRRQAPHGLTVKALLGPLVAQRTLSHTLVGFNPAGNPPRLGPSFWTIDTGAPQ